MVMKKLISKLTLFLVAPQMILSGAFAQGSVVDLSAKLALREKFYTSFLDVQRDMNDIAKNEALKVWYGVKAKEYKLPKFRLAQTQALKQYVYSQNVIDWAGHYQATAQFDKTAAVLASYYYMLAAYISEVSTDPRDDGTMTTAKKNAQALADSSLAAAAAAELCLTKAASTAGSLSQLASACLNTSGLQAMTSFVTDTLNNKFFTGSNQVLSLTGHIQGNKVEQLLENFYEPDFIKYMAPMTESVIKNYAGMDVRAFKEKMTDKASALTSFFTVADGFPAKAHDHKVWQLVKPNGKKNIYGQVMNAIDNAKQSIFIDVFFLGGSIGASLAKRLIEKVQTDKNFWVYIINDRNNPLGYNNEMAPVYNYLRAYAEKFSEDRIVLVAPQVELKRTAFPPIADLILKDATLLSLLTEGQRNGLIGQLSFYPKGKSDHSKVVVVDGLDKANGIAFVGSKNYTDSSGGVAYDEVTKIQGPAVAAILDSYYYDLTIALKQLKGGSPFSNPQYLADLYSKNFSDGENNESVQIAKILAKVDVLNRSKLSGVTDLKWPTQGSTPIMIGENNAYGTIRTALPQVIAGIRSADKQIIISEQFIYEPSVVRALKEQVAKKIQGNPNFRVYILLADMADHFNPLKEFSHIPNVSYVDEFSGADSKIQVKWKKVPATHLQALAEVKKANDLGYAPEYHLKSLSIDGVTAAEASQCGNQAALAAGLASTAPNKLPLLISGSANKDVMTMTGGFREYQVVVYDRATTVAHDCQFWSRFNSSDESENVDVKGMNLPASLKDKGLNEPRFNQLVRDIVNGTYNVMTGYFGI
jgi:phosphatidylserine/phosphatidylglycerophosphate/cardiolipin synthase-like enzyme